MLRPASNPEAFSTNHTTYKQVGELLLNPQSATATNPFNKTNMTTLINMIYGSSGDMSTQITSLTSTAASTRITAKDLRANTYNKTNGQSIVVRLGGLDWIVTYVSTDTSGNLVATLWLSNNHQEAWGWNGTSNGDKVSDEIGWNKNLGKYYGFVNGGLYSDWSADWYTDKLSSSSYPSNMYGTSYIRTETLNNPYIREYAADDSTLTSAASQITTLSGHPFALYTVSDFGLTNYITTPDQMKWMVNLQDPIGSAGCWCSNDSLTSDNAYNYSGSWYISDYNYESKTGYDYWGRDYLWLPSMAETGCSDTDDGLWETNTAERTTYDGSTTSLTASSSIGSNNSDGVADSYSWSRSASFSCASNSCNLDPSGSDGGNFNVTLSRAVRPAILLTLNSAASHTAKPTGVTITLNKEGGSGGSTEVSVAFGDTMPTLASPAKSLYAFGGYYTSTNGGGTKIYNADGTPAISASIFTADTTLYAYWTDISSIVTSSFDYTVTDPYQNDSFIEDEYGYDISGGCYGWCITEDGYIKSTNEGVDDSYSGFELSVTVTEPQFWLLLFMYQQTVVIGWRCTIIVLMWSMLRLMMVKSILTL